MATQEKIDSIAELKERIQASPIVVMTKYVGINAGQVSDLRKKLRDNKVKLKVYKNTLAMRVLDELGLSQASSFMEGPTAWAFSDDPAAMARHWLAQGARRLHLVDLNGAFAGKPAYLEAVAKGPVGIVTGEP